MSLKQKHENCSEIAKKNKWQMKWKRQEMGANEIKHEKNEI